MSLLEGVTLVGSMQLGPCSGYSLVGSAQPACTCSTVPHCGIGICVPAIWRSPPPLCGSGGETPPNTRHPDTRPAVGYSATGASSLGTIDETVPIAGTKLHGSDQGHPLQHGQRSPTIPQRFPQSYPGSNTPRSNGVPFMKLTRCKPLRRINSIIYNRSS